MEIAVDNLQGAGVLQLLEEHLADMYATSPPESVHALDVDALKHPSITFWSAQDNGDILGCIALKELDAQHGEIKSMRTSSAARNRGVASQLLSHLIHEAKARGYQRLSLETGAEDYFIAARALYEKNDFQYCDPFASYQPDPNSKFMTRELRG